MFQIGIEASLHLDLLSLFFNILSKPQTKVFEIVKYILMMSDSKSTTWSVQCPPQTDLHPIHSNGSIDADAEYCAI